MKNLIGRIYWWWWKRNAVRVDKRFLVRNVLYNAWQKHLREEQQ